MAKRIKMNTIEIYTRKDLVRNVFSHNLNKNVWIFCGGLSYCSFQSTFFKLLQFLTKRMEMAQKNRPDHIYAPRNGAEEK